MAASHDEYDLKFGDALRTNLEYVCGIVTFFDNPLKGL
jgi:hypothetical protein